MHVPMCYITFHPLIQESQPVGRGPLLGCEGIATGMQKQLANADAHTCIFTCASSGRACACMLHLHEHQVHVHATHANGAVCACVLAAADAEPSPIPPLPVRKARNTGKPCSNYHAAPRSIQSAFFLQWKINTGMLINSQALPRGYNL